MKLKGNGADREGGSEELRKNKEKRIRINKSVSNEGEEAKTLRK